MKARRSKGINAGSASILLIFAVLSLISFATLTLVNSKADYNLSNNLAQRQLAYYRACHEGNAFVAAVNSDYENFPQDDIIKKSIPITDNQSLDITLMSNIRNSSTNSTHKYTITQWQIVDHRDTEYDYTLPVYK